MDQIKHNQQQNHLQNAHVHSLCVSVTGLLFLAGYKLQ